MSQNYQVQTEGHFSVSYSLASVLHLHNLKGYEQFVSYGMYTRYNAFPPPPPPNRNFHFPYLSGCHSEAEEQVSVLFYSSVWWLCVITRSGHAGIVEDRDE